MLTKSYLPKNMSQNSQNSQSQDASLPLGQRTQLSKEAKLIKARQEFNSKLITKNNNQDEDEGVNLILLSLEKDDRAKALKSALKPQVLAGLAFLLNTGLEAAKEQFKGIKVEDLKSRLIDRYDSILPSCPLANQMI